MESSQQILFSMHPSTQEAEQQPWMSDLNDFGNMNLPIQGTSQDAFAKASYTTINPSFNSNVTTPTIYGNYSDILGTARSSSVQLIPDVAFSSVGHATHNYTGTDSQLLVLPGGYPQPSLAPGYSHLGGVNPQDSLISATYPNTLSHTVATQNVVTQPSVVGTGYSISDNGASQESLMPTGYADSFAHHTTPKIDNDHFSEVKAIDVLASQSGSCFEGNSAQTHNTSDSPAITSDKSRDDRSDAFSSLHIPPEADHGLIDKALEDVPPLRIPKPKSRKRNRNARNRRSTLNTTAANRDYPTPEGITPGSDKPLPVEFGFLEFDRSPEAYPKIKDAVLDVNGNVIIGNSGDPLRHILGRNGQPVLPNEISRADLLNGRNPYYWQASHPLLRQKDIFDRVTDYAPSEIGKQGRVNALANVRNRWRAKYGGLDFIPKTIPEDKKSFSKWDLQRVDSLSSEQIRLGIVWEICPDRDNTMRDPFSGTTYKIPQRKPSPRVPLLLKRLTYLKDKAAALGLPSWERAKSLEILNNSRFMVARANRQKQDNQSFNGSNVSIHGSENAGDLPEVTGQDGKSDPDSNEIYTQEQGTHQLLAQLDGTPPSTEITQISAEDSSLALLDGFESNFVAQEHSSLLPTQDGVPAISPVAGPSQSKKRKSLHDDDDDEDNGVASDVADRPTKRAAIEGSSGDFFNMTANQIASLSLPVSTTAQSIAYGPSDTSIQDPWGLGATSEDGINLNWL
ncbi:hypothetical protein EV356DRAFT_573234 [Viridothelium virens]|uniref:Uncharacterized protein n=1 Tax=Viridothelium virens TaxID=1048519 RepID=A0A6A6HKJ1_VIRVR|nr:hypothetical protein EV356DRAFT_573234 [Viridothelium virens]